MSENFVHKLWNEWIGGVKRFLTFPYGPEDRPSQDYQLVNKYWTVESDSCDKLVVSVSAHTNPQEGDLWVDTNRVVPVVSTTTDYTLLSTDLVVLANASGGAFSVAMASTQPNAYRDFFIKKVDSSNNIVTVNPNGTETIDGATLGYLVAQNESLHLVSDGANWKRLDPHIEKYIVASSLDFNTGTITADFSLTSFISLDNNVAMVAEVVGAPGFDLTFSFSNVPRINSVLIHGYYDGAANHEVEVQLYNFNTTNWDSFIQMAYISLEHPTQYNLLLPSDTNYISNNAARVRIYHVDGGNAAHEFYLDYIALVYRG